MAKLFVAASLVVAAVFWFAPQSSDASSSSDKIIAIYWGQNTVSHKPGIVAADYEKPLSHFCQNTTTYDIILISFLHVFFDPANKDNFPSLNLANHCFTSSSAEYPNLYSCPSIGTAVKECQANGKKVLLSMGGATATYSIPNDTMAIVLAERVWGLFLAGSQISASLRPFGDAILDGIDLDIENHNQVGYSAFAGEIRRLMNTDSTKKYLLTAAPQCPFPDASVGPKTGALLDNAARLVDYLFVQYYNNFCYPGSSDFTANIQQWYDWSESVRLSRGKSPKIIIGLPAGAQASHKAIYLKTIDEVKTIIEEVKTQEHFGGFMLWDAGWDQHHVTNNKTYSQHIRDYLPVQTGNDASKKSVSMVTIMVAAVLAYAVFL